MKNLRKFDCGCRLWMGLIIVSQPSMQNLRELGWVELGFFYGERQKKIDFRGYPSIR